jgi:hypothetical protein
MIVQKGAVLTQYVLSPYSFGQEIHVHLFKTLLPIQLTNVTRAGIKTALLMPHMNVLMTRHIFYTVNATPTYNKNSKHAK